MGKVRVRIAPSPTGDPHIGTGYTALFNWAFAKANKGTLVLRIEDTDQARLVAGSEEKIYEALEWLKLVPDESPRAGGEFGPYKQSERLHLYQKHIDELVEKDKAYWCDCTPERLTKIREEQQAKGLAPTYDRKCRDRKLTAKDASVVRLKVPAEGETSFTDQIRGQITFKNKDIDDQVLLKSDHFPTYHLANVVDDHLMEISHVIRGEEWLSSTPKHVLLYQAFGWESPEFAHLPLLRNPDHSKLSKRKNPVSILWYRGEGYLSETLVNFLALLGWSMPADKEIFSLGEFVENFDLSRVDPVGPIFDIQKLDWLNGQYIRNTPTAELGKLLIEGGFTKRSKTEVERLIDLVKDRMKKLTDFDELTGYYFDKEVKQNPEELLKVSRHDAAGTADAIRQVGKTLAGINHTSFGVSTIEAALENQQKQISWNKTELFQVVRVAVTGGTTSPPLGETLEAIGQKEVIHRLEKAVEALG